MTGKPREVVRFEAQKERDMTRVLPGVAGRGGILAAEAMVSGPEWHGMRPKSTLAVVQRGLAGKTMGRGILNCLEKRDLLNQSAVSVELLRQMGERYEEEGLVHDAVDFYEKSGASEALGRLLENARETGDYFLLTRIHRALKTEPGQNELLEIAGQAQKLGKHAFASQAYRHLGMEDPPKGTGDMESSGLESADHPESGQG